MNNNLYNYYIIDRVNRGMRQKVEKDLGAEYSALGLSGEERMTRRFEYLSSLETPHIHKDEKIVLIRTVANLPDVYTEAQRMGREDIVEVLTQVPRYAVPGTMLQIHNSRL